MRLYIAIACALVAGLVTGSAASQSPPPTTTVVTDAFPDDSALVKRVARLELRVTRLERQLRARR